MKKGFTLIELLAVIVILAILALIATPIILNIINDSRSEARNRSVDALTHAMGMAYETALLKKEEGQEITVQDILDNTKIDNELERDNESITTKDGVKCTLLIIDDSYVASCLDTKSIGKASYAKDITGKDTDFGTGFTGVIYRYNDNVLKNDTPIEPWCMTVSSMGYNSCVVNDYLVEVFNDEEECQSTLALLLSYPEYADLADAATCEQYTPSYEVSSSSIQENYYLKNVIINDIVKESYVCMRYDATKQVCLRGGDYDFFGTYDGINDGEDVLSLSGLHPTGNLALLDEEIRPYFNIVTRNCYYRQYDAACSEEYLEMSITFDGYVGFTAYTNPSTNTGNRCAVSENGLSSCYPIHS